MKFRHTRITSSSSRKRSKKGFALIATLTLMMLLAMLAVTLMATAASQNRIALQTMLQAEARQQALVGLDAAIGALQVELGPDQRVTANSGILSQNEGALPQHLLGVWNSWDGPIYGKSVSGLGNKITETYKQGREQMFRRWLISSRDVNETRTMDAANKLCNRMPGQRVCLVGEGTLGKSRTAQHYVYADLLSMPTMGKNEACFAWWVGGENQKAKVSVQDPKEATDVYDALHRTWDTPAPSFVDNKDLDFLPEKIEEPARVVTMASLPLLASASQAAGMPYFFDVTTTSYSLLTNTSMGGIKQDLCLLLNKQNLKGTDFEARSNQDCPLVENNDAPRGTEADMPIGSWQNLHAYYNCWPDGSARDSDNFTARLLGNLDGAYTRMSGSVFEHQSLAYTDNPDAKSVGSSNLSYYDSRVMTEQGSKSAGYARTPVMLAFVNNFGLTSQKDGKVKNSKGEEEDAYTLRMCFAPMFLWWNPYNVPMKVRGQQLWAQSIPYKTICMETYAIGSKTNNQWGWSDYALTQGGTDDNSPGFGSDYGEYFQKSLTDNNGDIEFQPGEVIFFSPGQARTNRTEGFTNPWIPGYHPRSVSGYRALFYTKKKKTEVDSGDWYIAIRMATQGQGEKYYYANRGTDGYHFAPRRPECITVMCGYNGQDGTNIANTAYGKRASSPQRMLLGWYDPDEAPGRMMDSASDGLVFVKKKDGVWKADGTQEDGDMPYYIASVGVVAKSANKNIDGNVKPGDFRAKIWQHSSPAFWGSAIVRPDDQMRMYHPYQLATLPVSSGMNSAPMDSIGNNGYLGVTGDGEMVSFASVMELPVHPPFSLAGFAGMRLQPGWYQSSAGGGFAAQGALRRMEYQGGVPGVGIGNSFADPCLPADDVYSYFQNKMENSELSSNSRLFGDFFDHGLLINDAMWDRWFCSSVSDMPDKSGKKEARDVLQRFLTGQEELPVSRYKRVSTPYNNEALVERIMKDDGWKYIAQYLMIDGGFNVNSISEEAWAAVLQGLAKRKLVAGKDGRLTFVEDGKTESQVLFSRFMLSTTDKSIDGLGGYSAMQGSSEFRNGSGMTSAWGEVRMLEPEGIKLLAQKIVEQVRKRGPFLSMSDFVNRRLEAGENGLKGALQAAIDATDINRDFDTPTDTQVTNVPSGDLFKNPDAAKGSIHTAAPGYLIQSDVLASLGNILTVRDDTFTVRAYGCVRNPNKAVLAQAWCEAVVQRTMNYVDPTNNPEDSDYTPEGKKNGQGLSDTNKVMGRQFRIVSFKWLDNWDI